jgi:ABC-type Fe3+-hydroxamate transport system substrate-binding protein
MNPSIRQFAHPPTITDQIGKKIMVPLQPLRIISVVPSQTELLHALGLEEEVIGITKFCVHPENWFRTKTRVGGTKKLNIEQIRSLHPNLVIANKEENIREDILSIETFCPVWTSDVVDIKSALDMIQQIGNLTSTTEKAIKLIHRISTGFSSLHFEDTYRCAYLIWKDPWMVAGKGTFIHEMMKCCGLVNVMGKQERYPTVEMWELKQKGVQLLLLSSEPFPFKMKHLKELTEILPEVKLLLVDGEMFSWYGSRMIYVPDYFRKIREQMEIVNNKKSPGG